LIFVFFILEIQSFKGTIMLTFAQVVAFAAAAAPAAAAPAAPVPVDTKQEQKYQLMRAPQTYAKVADSKFTAKAGCGFVCRHSVIHCAHIGCFDTLVSEMKKDKGNDYKSDDGELYFCQKHNTIMSILYNRHKNLVNWWPPKEHTFANIRDEYICWAIPRALEIRTKFNSLLQEQSVPPTGHKHCEKLLSKQLAGTLACVFDADEMIGRFANGYIPPKFNVPAYEVVMDWDKLILSPWE
jgi:hypothetical protein